MINLTVEELHPKTRIRITIVASVFEFIIFYVLETVIGVSPFQILFLSLNLNSDYIIKFLSLLTPASSLFLVNHYLLSPWLYRLGIYLLAKFNLFSFYNNKFDQILDSCINFLISCKVHWGIRNTDTEIQHANLCEGLVALIRTEYADKHRTIFNRALINLLNSVTENGLKSKSLPLETTVCTAMYIYVCSLIEKSNNTLEKCVIKLWSVRNDTGWGIYLKQHSNDTTRLCPTFWALRAIVRSGKHQIFGGFDDYVCTFYERRGDSLFGYTFDDNNRVSITSMFLILYYELPTIIRTRVANAFDPQKAVKYIIDETLRKECYTEIEQIVGTGDGGLTSIKKVPWNHITLGYVMEAISLAYLHKDVKRQHILRFAEELISITNRNVHYIPDQNRCFFSPATLEPSIRGILTFPTAYFSVGLHEFISNCLGGDKK